MRIALISDVHGNLPAFQAVLAAVEASGVDETLVPGRPGRLRRPARRVRRAGGEALRRLPRRQPRPRRHRQARHRRLLVQRRRRPRRGRGSTSRDEALEFLRALEPADATHASRASTTPARATRSGSTCSPRWQAHECMDAMGPRVGADRPLARGALLPPRRRRGRPARTRPAAPSWTSPQGDWLINPGGVGQPRDGDPRAAWLLLDLRHLDRDWRRVGLPHRRGRQAIERAGLPAGLAERLYSGQ